MSYPSRTKEKSCFLIDCLRGIVCEAVTLHAQARTSGRAGIELGSIGANDHRVAIELLQWSGFQASDEYPPGQRRSLVCEAAHAPTYAQPSTLFCFILLHFALFCFILL